MAAQNTDLFLKVASNTGWQLNSSGISDAAVTSFGLVSSTGLPTDTAVLLTIDRVDASGTKTPAKMERILGVVSGNNIVSCVRGVEGTAQAHAGGAVVEIIISAGLWNKFITAMIVEHGQDGKHVPPATAKTSLVDADLLGIFDSAASFMFKKITWANIKKLFANLILTFIPDDGSYTGITTTMTAGENLVAGDLVYFKSDEKAYKADADAIATMPVMAMAMATINSGASGIFLLQGIYRNDALYNLTAGNVMYASGTAGGVTQTQPSGVDGVVQVVGIAINENRIYFNPSINYITHV